MSANRIDLRTDDGVCPTFTYGDKSAPSVLMYIDGIGMRPAVQDLAARLATAGYYVLLPDLFYRIGPYTAHEPKALFSDPVIRQDWWGKVMSTTNAANVMRDTKAFLAALPGTKVGVVGYCMGGRMALSAAGTYPDRIVAAASYHGGNLAVEEADSPHLLAPKMKAQVYVGGAIEDQSFPEEQKQRLEAALTAAKVDHVIETYQARHGWVPSDTPVYDATAAERHWETMLALFERTLR